MISVVIEIKEKSGIFRLTFGPILALNANSVENFYNCWSGYNLNYLNDSYLRKSPKNPYNIL